MLKQAVLALLLSLAGQLRGQSHSIYQNITTGNGLPSNYVFAVTEDEHGFLWAGTDKGLCRYDGFRWQVWDRDNGLPGNYINSVFSDRHGGLWLLIGDKGFFHFNSQNGALQPVPLRGLVLPYTVQTDTAGNLYAETAGTDAGAGAYTVLPGDVAHPLRVFETAAVGLFLRGDAGKRNVYALVPDNESFLKCKQAVKSRWPLRPLFVADPSQQRLQPVHYISDSEVLSNTEYYRFARDGRPTMHHVLFAPNNSYAQTCRTAEGLYVYDIKTGYWFINNLGEKKFYNAASGLGTDYVNHIYQTHDGTVVISTLGAGLQLIKNRYRKTFPITAGTVRTVLPSGKNWYVLAGEAILKTTNDETLKPAGTAGPSAFVLFKTGDTVVSGGLKGLSFFKESGTVLQPLGSVDLAAGISSILREGKGYLAGTYGAGLLRFGYGRIRQRVENYPLRIVEKLVPIKNGWAALSYEDGLFVTNGESHRRLSQKEGLLSNSVYSVYPSGDSLIIGTKGGIAVYARQRILQAFRFPPHAAQEKALASFFDANRVLWVVSNRSLYRLQKEALQPVGSHPLVTADDVITTAAYNPESGELAIGSNKTFSLITVSAIKPVSLVAPPQLTAVWLNGVLQKTDVGTLGYDFGHLRFALAPQSVSPFAQGRFYYRLRGLSDGWSEMTDSLAVSFAALRPGDYSLWAKTMNVDGYESEAVQLAAFTVQRPFWQRWPFLLLCACVVAFLAGVVVRQVDKARQRRKEAAQRVQLILQAERERIAKDLHDHLGTNLTTIIAQTDNIENRLYKGELQQASHTVQNLSAQTRETMNVLRETIWAVQETEHPLPDFLLRMRTFLQRFFESTGIQWELKNEASHTLSLTPAQTLHLFRIVQEASQNILKHAGAKHASYRLASLNNELTLVIEDNGKGFTQPRQLSNGLANIQERARQLGGLAEIKTAPSVRVTVTVPV